MNTFIKNTFKDVVKLVLANLGILVVWQMIFFAVYNFDSDIGLVAIFAVYGMAVFVGLIYYALIWSVISIIPSLIGFLLYRNSMDKTKRFMGFVIASFVMIGIYVGFMGCFYINLLLAGLNVWLHLIPIVISAIILIMTIKKVNASYKTISGNAYVGANIYLVNNYPVNQYNYGYINANNQMNQQYYNKNS
ncbi:MAG: hypothetical protein J6A59_14700 [Lachnospiraceae bacterium]|nr:hypothetical protein [Lachnospiraceae bacterium]